MICRYDFSNETDSDFAVISDMLSYISPDIQKIEVSGREIGVSCFDEKEQDVRSKIDRLLEMIHGGKIIDREANIKTLVDHTDRTPLNTETVFPELVSRGDVTEICKGVYAYSGLFLKVFRYFDKKIREFAFQNFEDVREYEFPVLYPIDNFEKGRYFETFPHYIMFQTVMKNDLDVLDRFAAFGTKADGIFSEMKQPVNVLRNAACVPVYSIFENTIVDEKKPLCFMIAGKCFRNEGDNVLELARLNEFYMLEYVFLGTPQQCSERIESSRALWQFWADTFQVNVKLDTANDSFFASNYKKLRLFQMLGDSKREFKWKIPARDLYIACASANLHRTHFSKPYAIKSSNGAFCYTACFAFGIERLTYALLSQKGLDVSKWDQQTRDEIASYVDL